MLLIAGANARQRTSGADGSFDFGGLPGGQYSCQIQPRPDSGLTRGWVWEFDIPDGQAAFLLASIWPAGFDTATVRGVGLSAPATVRVGDTIPITTTVTGPGGTTLAIAASLLLIGDAVAVQPDGSFRASRPGSATVVAWAPDYTSVTTITVIP